MRHNPKDDYRWLDEELRALDVAEEPEEDFPEEEEEYEYEWYSELKPEENEAVDFGRILYADEEYDDIYAAEPVSKKEQKRLKKEAQIAQKKEKKLLRKQRRKLRRLVLLAILEIAAIIYIIRWWIPWLT